MRWVNCRCKGPNVFVGYWNMPDKTAADFTADGFFITGDQAVIDADGYVSIVGRSRDMVISGGLNVYPKEIELLIDALPGVKESAVIGLPDARFWRELWPLWSCRNRGAAVPGESFGTALGTGRRLQGTKAVFFAAGATPKYHGQGPKEALREEYRNADRSCQDIPEAPRTFRRKSHNGVCWPFEHRKWTPFPTIQEGDPPPAAGLRGRKSIILLEEAVDKVRWPSGQYAAFRRGSRVAKGIRL